MKCRLYLILMLLLTTDYGSGVAGVHYLGMVPCARLVLLECWIQLSYTDVESSPGALT